ncbi:MAG: hypothetical protein WA651_16835 [Candidatus Sulfotelmatobacter sp.]
MNQEIVRRVEGTLRDVLGCFVDGTRPYSKKKLPDNVLSQQDIADYMEDYVILDKLIVAAAKAKGVLLSEKQRGIERRPLVVMAEELIHIF